MRHEQHEQNSADDNMEGARPRHASCGRCGYLFNGVPVRERVIVCPECGATARFAFSRPRMSRGIERASRAIWLIAIIIGAALAILVIWNTISVAWRGP